MYLQHMNSLASTTLYAALYTVDDANTDNDVNAA